MLSAARFQTDPNYQERHVNESRDPGQVRFRSPSAVEKHINAIFGKLTLSAEDGAHHRRVAAVLTFLRNQDLRGSAEARE